MAIRAVDLFCGAGGLTYGLQQADIDVRAGFDIEPDCRFPYTENNDGVDFVEGDLADDISVSMIETYLNGDEDDYSLIAGCAPCQPFSSMSNGNEKRASNHEKWGLMDEFGEIISKIQPDLVTMENVPAVQKHDPYEEFRDRLVDHDYSISDHVVECPEYGVPQQRKRLVLLASKHGRIELLDPTHNPEDVTVASQLRDRELESLEAGETAEEDPLHDTRGLSSTNIKRIKHSKPGGTWKDWPEDLRLACHKKESGQKYVDPYGRMEWGEQAPTITTQFHNYGSGRFGHPEENRAISLREGALLQTFPQDYSFIEPGDETSAVALGKLIGNAVPVKLAEAIGESLQRHVEGEEPQQHLTSVASE